MRLSYSKSGVFKIANVKHKPSSTRNIKCPSCGEGQYHDNVFFLDKNNKVVGCSSCIKKQTFEDYLSTKLFL